MNPHLPFEILEFEQLLQKPNSDASGLASFFGGGEIWVTRVPARLDVMGGIADYSGANVCQAVLGRALPANSRRRPSRRRQKRAAPQGER